MRDKIVGYGELLFRLTPQIHGDLILQSRHLEVGFAGAEANVLCNLALWGQKTSFISALPDNILGQKALLYLRGQGVDCKPIIKSKGRIGTYYVEHGQSIRSSKVTYDRSYSVFSQQDIPEKVWKETFNNASHFVISGVTMALGNACRANLFRGIQIAKDNNVKIVFDLNYRRSLWKGESISFYDEVLKHTDVLFANYGAIKDIWGGEIKTFESLDDIVEASLRSGQLLFAKGNFEAVFMSARMQENADSSILAGIMITEGGKFISKYIPIRIKDRLGGGDAFLAGSLYGILNQWEAGKIIDFANASYALTQIIKGDLNLFSIDENLEIAKGNYTGMLKR